MTSKKILLLGGVPLDRYYEVDRYPLVGQDTLIRSAFDRVGGCCLNVAVTLKSLGNDPSIVNQYGDDEAGKQISEYVRSLGISTEHMSKNSDRHTGYCLNILSKDGERTFFTYRGCEADFPEEMAAQDQSLDFAATFITGYYLLKQETAEAVIELIGRLRLTNCPVIFDPGPLVDEISTETLRKILTEADWVVPNAAEVAMMQRKIGLEGGFNPWFFKQGGCGIIVKKGGEGEEVFTAEDHFVHAGFKVNIQDTTGAGDSFAGGLIHGLVNGYPLAQTVAIASACGAITTTFKGPHGVFSMEEVMKLVDSEGKNHVK